MKKSISDNLYLSLLLLGTFSLVVTLATYFLSKNTNTLHRNSQWVSQKKSLEKGVMFAHTYVEDTQALYGDRLNVGSWAGYQEVLFSQPISVKNVKASLLFVEDAYVYIVLGKNLEGFWAIRLSLNNLYPSAIVRADAQGKFLEITPLRDLKLEAHIPYLISISATGNQPMLSLNGQKITDLSPDIGRYGQFGFRGSAKETYIDEVRIETTSNQTFFENFSNHHWLRYSVTTMIIMVMLYMALFFIPVKKKVFLAIMMQITAIVVLTILIVADHKYFLGNYPNPFSPLQNLRREEKDLVEEELTQVTKKLNAAQSSSNLNSEQNTSKKVLFIGTSQTWGAGASTESNTFIAKAERDLRIRSEKVSRLAQTNNDDNSTILGAFTSINYEFLNTGVSGARSAQLLRFYENNWISIKPDLVVINLGHNDEYFQVSPEQFSANIQRFVDLNKANGILTLLVVEANSPEERTNPNQLHDVMREISANNAVPVVEMHQQLYELRDTGILWWDIVHMTDYGHAITAKILEKEIADLLDIEIEVLAQ